MKKKHFTIILSSSLFFGLTYALINGNERLFKKLGIMKHDRESDKIIFSRIESFDSSSGNSSDYKSQETLIDLQERSRALFYKLESTNLDLTEKKKIKTFKMMLTRSISHITKPESCLILKENDPYMLSGNYQLYPKGGQSFKMYDCIFYETYDLKKIVEYSQTDYLKEKLSKKNKND